MTVKATLTAAFPEARRISNFLERDWGEAGAVVSLDERPDGALVGGRLLRGEASRRKSRRSSATASAPTPLAR